MWFYMIAAFLLLVGVLGGVASGGIFTLIFVPLGLVMLIWAVIAGSSARKAEASSESGTRESRTRASKTEPDPLPHGSPAPAARPSTPEDLVDARRAQQ